MKRKARLQLQQKTIDELRQMLEETRSSLVKSTMEVKTEKTKNRRIIARTRDEVARILTILRQKEYQEKK